MANITPRRDKNGNITSYTIRVYHGYDSSGKRLKPFTTSYKPEKRMTAKQAEKAAQRFADEFESECLHFGEANSSMRLSDFVPRYLEIAKQTLSPATYEFYKLKIDSLIIPALGHLKLKDITLCGSKHQASTRAARSRRYRDHEQVLTSDRGGRH